MPHETTLMSVLDQLAHAAAEAPETPWTTAVLATAVAALEQAAGASLGATEHDPPVVLHRRLTRAHRLLAAEPGAASPELVQAHLQALQRPAPSPGPVPADDQAGPVSSAAAAPMRATSRPQPAAPVACH